MGANTLIILELIIFNGIILVWAVREFLSVQPEKKAPEEKSAGSADEAGHPEG